jgi:hypothetical protein
MADGDPILSEPLASESAGGPDDTLELVMAQMQAAALFFPKPTQEPEKGA